MKEYRVTLSIVLEAKTKEQAKKEFWLLVDDEGNDQFINNNSLEVVELYKP